VRGEIKNPSEMKTAMISSPFFILRRFISFYRVIFSGWVPDGIPQKIFRSVCS
jgi:hypothetical protein